MRKIAIIVSLIAIITTQYQVGASENVGQCMGSCASEQGICISQCNGNGQCIGNCAAAQGRCFSRCY